VGSTVGSSIGSLVGSTVGSIEGTCDDIALGFVEIDSDGFVTGKMEDDDGDGDGEMTVELINKLL
jgi:hypothetical protein